MLDLSTPIEKVELLDWEGRMPDLSNEDYHADSSKLSSSLVSDFLEYGPKYYKQQLNPLTRVNLDSEAIQLGTMLHAANLEGLISDYVLMPDVPSIAERKKQGAEDLRSIKLVEASIIEDFEKKGKTLVTQKQYDAIHGAHTAFKKNKLAMKYLKMCEVEKSFQYHHPESGIDCRFRTDLISIADSLIVDYKTTGVSLNPKSLSRHAVSMKYPIKAAHYVRGAERLFAKRFNYVWLFQSTKAPYNLAVLNFKDIDLRLSIDAHTKILVKLAKLQKTKNGLDQDFTTMACDLDMPPYALDMGWVDG